MIKRPSDHRVVKSVLFIQCAGQRDPEHLPYCSGMCCATTLKQARYVTDGNPDAMAMVIYKDIRTPGKLEYYYKEAQNTPGVMLAKGEVTGIREEWDKLIVTVEDSLLGEKAEIETEMVVLATGMVPTTKEPQDYLIGLQEAAAKGDEAKAKYIETTKKNPSLFLILDIVRVLNFLSLKVGLVLSIQTLYVSSMKQEEPEYTLLDLFASL